MNNATIDKHIANVDLFGDIVKTPSRGPLADRFMAPPFSVLNAREGPWQDRKQKWIDIGIKSELGRGAVQSSLASARAVQTGDGLDDAEAWVTSSIFDPVLCELLYKWFCPTAGQVIDPFAGGSVRGIVAAFMGLSYWGCDLRTEQIAANNEQAAELCNGEMVAPVWVSGDSRNALEKNTDAPMCVDFVFSCPPYGDLEVYSDSPEDISNMSWSHFCTAYLDIIEKSCWRLKNNRFAAFVVGDVRDQRNGAYRGFPALTTQCFEKAGLRLHNEIVLLTPVGTLPVRAAAAFNCSRKLGKTHQNILVFVKGDPEKAAAKCNEGATP